MRLPLGSTDVSASGGTVTLVGRRGEGWSAIARKSLSLSEAVALLDTPAVHTVHSAEQFSGAEPSHRPNAPRFARGEGILWRFGRVIETARVVRDDDRGLVVWIASGSPRLEPGPTDGSRSRDVPLEARFEHPLEDPRGHLARPGCAARRPDGKTVVGLVLPRRRWFS